MFGVLMTPLEGAYLALAVLRQAFDWNEARKKKEDRDRAEALERRVHVLEERIAKAELRAIVNPAVKETTT